MLKQNTKKISLIIGIALLALLSWFIYQKYFKPTYNLNELLPNNYQISLELSLDHYTFPALEQDNLLKNKGINVVYQQINQQLDTSLNQILNNEAKNIIKSSKQGLIFFENSKNFGLILKLPFNQGSKNISNISFKPLFSSIINDQILVLSNNEALLNKINQQSVKPKINPYLSFTFNPWLKINLNKSFFEEKYDYPIFTDLQQILLPLSFANSEIYNLELDNTKNTLQLKLKPQIFVNKNGDLQSFINLIDEKAQIILGFNNIEDLTKELDNNKNFKTLWGQLDNQLFLNQQLSLSKLSKTIKSPIILAFGENFWQIITNQTEEPLVKIALTDYLAQFKPKEIIKILPDNTRAIELIADPNKITWQETDLNGSKITYQDLPLGKLGWLVNNDKLIISNNLDQISTSNINFTCNSNSKSTILNIFYLNPQFSKLNLNSFLNNFSYFSGISYTNGEIRLCLGLK